MGLTKCKSSVSLCISENEEADFDSTPAVVSSSVNENTLSSHKISMGAGGMSRSHSTGFLGSLHSFANGMKKSMSGMSLASMAKTVTESESSSTSLTDKHYFPLSGCLKIKTQRGSVKITWEENKRLKDLAPDCANEPCFMPEEEDWGEDEFLFMDDEDEAPASPSQPTEETPSTRRVTFTTISIHLHPRILGDNPSVQDGYPISIGWKAESSTELGLDDYEAQRTGPQRTKSEMMVPKDIRKEWLKEEGVTRWQFSCTKRDIEFIQKCRELERSRGKRVSVKRNIPKS
jgi:hypothetical protein